MIIFILIILLLLFFEKKTRKYLNPYKLIMIFGKKGSGKTTCLTKIAITHIKRGYKVYSTVEIPGTYQFKVEDIGFKTFEENSVVLIDEVGMIWDNRDFKNFKNEVRDFFKFQRQYKLKVYLFSQTFDIDLKLRNLTDEMYLLTNFMRVFSIQRRIIKTITIKNDTTGQGVSTLSDDYKFDLPLFGGLKLTFIPRYVAFFKSYDPKKLAYIDGTYYAFNELQERYLSTRDFLLDNVKVVFLNIYYKLCKLRNQFVRFLFLKIFGRKI